MFTVLKFNKITNKFLNIFLNSFYRNLLFKNFPRMEHTYS